MHKSTADIDFYKEDLPHNVKEQLGIFAAAANLEIEALPKKIWHLL